VRCGSFLLPLTLAALIYSSVRVSRREPDDHTLFCIWCPPNHTHQQFHTLVNSLSKVLFSCPSQYLSSIGLASSYSPLDGDYHPLHIGPALPSKPTRLPPQCAVSWAWGGAYGPFSLYGVPLSRDQFAPRTPTSTVPRRAIAPHTSMGFPPGFGTELGPTSFATTTGVLVSFLSCAD
jgi:hypothetical protein